MQVEQWGAIPAVALLPCAKGTVDRRAPTCRTVTAKCAAGLTHLHFHDFIETAALTERGCTQQQIVSVAAIVERIAPRF
jgi:hypothetical protein